MLRISDPHLLRLPTAAICLLAVAVVTAVYCAAHWLILTSSQTRPANDDFANALALAGATGSVTGENRAATREADEPFSDPLVGASV